MAVKPGFPFASTMPTTTLAVCARSFGHVKARTPSPMVNPAGPFANGNRGFEHNTNGWYDSSPEGGIGCCGNIRQVEPENRGR